MSIELKNLFKFCLDLLRNNESITGQKALRILGYFLNLKLLENKIGDENEINFEEINFEDLTIEQINKLKELSVFKNLSREREENLTNNLDTLWKIILSQHSKTRDFFPENKNFGIKKTSTLKKIIDKINNFNFDSIDTDILGEAYQEVIQDLMTGKVLGQYFTPTAATKMMVNLVNPQLKEDGTCESIYDPAMGTGGFLISSIRHLIKVSKETGININWEEISKGLISGREPDEDTYEFANSNMLISSGHLLNLENGDSIRNTIDNKYDIVLANPPFGIDGLNYKEINMTNKDSYLPIESKNAVSLFLQVIINILKVNGRCAIVLPDGKELNNKTENTLILIREFLMKTCDLKEVIQLQAGLFTFTNIKTCVLYFEKKKNGEEVFNIEYKKATKRSKNETRYFTFKDKNYETKEVNFYEYNHLTEEKKEIVKVPIEKIIENKFSLNYKDYVEKEVIEENNSIEWKTLGEVCEIISGKKKKSKDGKDIGLYPLYYCSILGNLYLDTFDYEGEGIIINKTNGSGKSMIYYGFNKYNVGETTIHFKSKNNDLLTKYIYYYLLLNISKLEYHYKGANQKSITDEDLFTIEIPILSLEKQNKVVEYLDILFENIKSNKNKIKELKQMNKYYLDNIIENKRYENKQINDLFEIINGKYNSGDMDNNGNIPFYSCSNLNPVGTHSVESIDLPEYLLLICSGGSKDNLIGENVGLGKCYHIKGKTACRSMVYALNKKNNININLKYIYHYLNINRLETNKLAHFTNSLGTISIEKAKTIQINIPSLENQQKIVDYCDRNESLINKLEEDIETSNNLAKEYFDMVINYCNEVSTEVQNNDEVDNTLIDLENNTEVEINNANINIDINQIFTNQVSEVQQNNNVEIIPDLASIIQPKKKRVNRNKKSVEESNSSI